MDALTNAGQQKKCRPEGYGRLLCWWSRFEVESRQYEYWKNQDEYDLSDAFTGLPDDGDIPQNARLPCYYTELPVIENEGGLIVQDCQIMVYGLDDKTNFITELYNIERSNENIQPININNNLQPGYYFKEALIKSYFELLNEISF